MDSRTSGSRFLPKRGIDGSYEVVFPRDVSECSFSATLGGPNSVQLGHISVSSPQNPARPGLASVYTFAAGMFERIGRDFYLQAFCL